MKTWMKWALGALLVMLIIGGGVYLATQTTPIVKTKTITLTVLAQEGSFEIVSADALQVKAGENVGFTISVSLLQGFSRAVKFSISGGPAGMQVAWQDNDDTWDAGQTSGNLQCNLILPLDNGLVGAYPLELTGTSQ